MSYINKSPEPLCLEELGRDPSHGYSDLKGECLDITRELLEKDQKGLCAYCQRSLNPVLRIEHWVPQSKAPDLSLKYSNFLAVCSGKRYINKMAGTFISFCEDHRKDSPLTFNPLLPAHMDTITYNSENRIISSNTVLQREFLAVLKLNYEFLCLDRAKVFERTLIMIIKEGQRHSLSKKQTLEKARRSLLERPVEFVDFVLFRLNQLIESSSTD